VNKWGVYNSLGKDTTEQMTQTNKKGILNHIMSWSATKGKREEFRRISHRLLKNWLVVDLPMSGD